jgi:endoglucanase
MKPKFLILFCFLFGGLTNSMLSQTVKKHGQLHVEGIQLKDKYNNDVVLRGMSFGWHNMWPRFYNSGAVKWLKNDWGCRVLRASMGIDLDSNCYKSKPEWSKEIIVAVIDAAIKEDIYVIVDWHSHNINLNEAKTFFAEMAQKYNKYPNIIYEIFNEPDYESWADVKAYSIEIISIIRQFDKNNIIIVGSPHWDQDVHIVADEPITGFSNLMYSLHFYAATHKKDLRDRGDYALSKGIPIFISEYGGMEASGDGVIDYKSWDEWLVWAEKNKISTICWSVSDKKEKCSVLLPTAKSGGNWKEEDLNETGKYARKILRSYAFGKK